MTRIYVERESETSTSRFVSVTQQLRDDRQVVTGANYPLITRSDNIQAVIDGITFYAYKVYPSTNLLAANASIQILITTAVGRPIGVGLKAECGAAAEVAVYENCTDVVGGTLFVPINRNRASTNVAVTGILIDPTSVTLGPEIYYDLVLGGTGGTAAGATVDSDYAVLKADTSYLFKMTNTSAQSQVAEFGLQWIENG